jgi:probable phosphoglycerate mutase
LSVAVELLFVRHALPVRRVTDDGSPADPPLSEVGRAQADALAEWLGHETVDAVYTSPMRRARETAAALEAALGLTSAVRDGLAEFDRDYHAYIPMEELKATDRERWLSLVQNMGSELDDPVRFQQVVIETVDEIVAAHPGQRVALVCHGGVVNAYAAHVVGRAAGDMFFFEPGYTSVSRFLASSAGHRSVVSLNETAHLRSLTDVEAV